MKKLIFLFLTLGVLFGEASAQNRSIQFKEGNWESLLQQAKKENKLIFLDCYTSWCQNGIHQRYGSRFLQQTLYLCTDGHGKRRRSGVGKAV